jgi:hypothetical protein
LGPAGACGVGVARPREATETTRRVLKYITEDGSVAKLVVFGREYPVTVMNAGIEDCSDQR